MKNCIKCGCELTKCKCESAEDKLINGLEMVAESIRRLNERQCLLEKSFGDMQQTIIKCLGNDKDVEMFNKLFNGGK